MNLETKLNKILTKWDMNNTKFYQAWVKGELNTAALKMYADEYGALIAELPNGWKTLDKPENVALEEEHTELWQKFAKELGTEISEPTDEKLVEFIAMVKGLFSEKPSTMGALFGFIAQQPSTSKAKLDGLGQYGLGKNADLYFEEHLGAKRLADMLLIEMKKLDEVQQMEAVDACEQMAVGVYNALDRIYEVNVK